MMNYHMTQSKYLLCFTLSLQLIYAEQISTIYVNTKEEIKSSNISSSTITKKDIDTTIQGNGFISSLLETNPNISIDDSSKNSTTAGEITPGKISINESLYYQNNFMIDNISNNSLLDPALNSFKSMYDVPGNENEIFIDLDLIEEVKVFDSNISAEYGGFTGGVISAKTIRAKDKTSFKSSVKYTSDELTNIHVHNKEKFEKATTDENQPKFKKFFFSTYYTTPIDENNGLILSYSKKKSIIPGAYFNGFKNKKRENESFLAKWSHYFQDDSILDLSFTHSPYNSTHIVSDIKDSETTVKGGGYSLKSNYEKDYIFWDFSSNFAIKSSQNTKESLDYQKEWLKSSSKDWGLDTVKDNGAVSTNQYVKSKEGGFGNIRKEQNSLIYNMKFTSKEFNTKAISHKLKIGSEFSYIQGSYNRLDDFYHYTDFKKNYLIDCNGDNTSCIDNEQYFTTRKVYKQDKINVNLQASSLYIEDSLKYKNLELSPGLRYDYNNYMQNSDLAPRLNGSIKLFKNTILFAGLNRYYGKSFLGYKLREARHPYYEEYRSSTQNVVQQWQSSADKESENKYLFSSLKTPYSDEKSLGLSQTISNINFKIKYVNREGKNSFLRKQGDFEVFTMPDGITKGYYKPFYYTNQGSSSAEIKSLSIKNKKPIKLKNLSFNYLLSTSWTKKSSNIESDYDDEDNESTKKYYYKGEFLDPDQVIKKSNPQKYKLKIDTAFTPLNFLGKTCKINLTSVINYTAKYTATSSLSGDESTIIYKEDLPDGTKKETIVAIYKDVSYQDSTTVDLKAAFSFKLKKKHRLIFTSEINNAFNEIVNLENETKKYKLGRQYWFSLAYKY